LRLDKTLAQEREREREKEREKMRLKKREKEREKMRLKKREKEIKKRKIEMRLKERERERKMIQNERGFFFSVFRSLIHLAKKKDGRYYKTFECQHPQLKFKTQILATYVHKRLGNRPL
jgi:predicted ATP-dependent protease